jgi:hypothetical protein
MTTETNENLTPEELAQRKHSAAFKTVSHDMAMLGEHDREQKALFDSWNESQKRIPGQQHNEVDQEDEKPAFDPRDDRRQAPEAPKAKQKPDDEVKPKPSRRGTKFGVDLIQERWATFEQQQAKALEGLNDLETKRDDALSRLDEFNGKHGDYLEQGYKKATGGDLKKMEHFRKLLEQQVSLQKGVDGLDKAIDQGRDRYQRDHHEFHSDAWGRIKQQGQVLEIPALVQKGEAMSKQHQDAHKAFAAKLPTDETPKHTKSITAQKVEEYARLSDDIALKAETNPALQREISEGREQVEKIGEDTDKRRRERQEERLPGHKHKQQL